MKSLKETMILESGDKNEQRNEWLDCAKKRGDGFFTFFGRGTDYDIAISRNIRIRTIDCGYSPWHKKWVRSKMKKLPGCKFITFTKYTKWAKQEGETFGTISLDLCNSFSNISRRIIKESEAIIQPGIETDIYITLSQGRETDMKKRTREQYNNDRNNEIIAIYQKENIKACIINIKKYRNNIYSKWMNVIHIKCTKS